MSALSLTVADVLLILRPEHVYNRVADGRPRAAPNEIGFRPPIRPPDGLSVGFVSGLNNGLEATFLRL